MLLPIPLALIVTSTWKPPLDREWTALTGPGTLIAGIENGALFYTASRETGAVDLMTGRIKWRVPVRRGTTYLSAKSLLVLPDDTGMLIAVNKKSGKTKRIAKFPPGTKLTGTPDFLFVISPAGLLQALSHEGKVRWRCTVKLPKPDWDLDSKPNPATDELVAYQTADSKEGLATAHLSADRDLLLVSAGENDTWGFGVADGKRRWHVRTAMVGTGSTNARFERNSVVGLGYQPKILTRNGKVRWSEPDSNGLGVVGQNLVVIQGEKLVGIDLATTKPRWTIALPQLGPDLRVSNATLVPPGSGSGEFRVQFGDRLVGLDARGRLLWTKRNVLTGEIRAQVGNRTISVDQSRILCYRPGPHPGFPTDPAGQKALANRLVATFEKLDDRERKQLIKLAKFATDSFLRRYVKASEARRSGQVPFLWRYDAISCLERMCTRANTKALLAALVATEDEEIETIVTQVADRDLAVPLLLDRIRARPDRPTVSLDWVSKQKNPTVVQFLIDALGDPKAPVDWRGVAIANLGVTGGQSGVEAIQRFRRSQTRKDSWQEVFSRNFDEGEDVLGTAVDAQAKKWRLVHSDALGNRGDLFIQAQDHGVWDEPRFTGCWTERLDELNLPNRKGGHSITELLAGKWIDVFPASEEINRDTDGDGLTDLVEARYGTNINDSDTDGDGVSDSSDPCPNAAPRSWGDHEKIVAACVEGWFLRNPYQTPAEIAVDGVRPFELLGYPGKLFWKGARKTQLERAYGGGINRIRFYPVRKRKGSEVTGTPWLRVSADGRRAETLMTRYSGGLNGEGLLMRLVKVGDEWFLSEMRILFVS